MTISKLFPLDCFGFIFKLRDSEDDLHDCITFDNTDEFKAMNVFTEVMQYQ